MTSYGEPRVWLEEFPLGQAVPFYCDHLGLRYQGEVIRADRWLPAWGEPLGQDAFFRIILLQQRGRQQAPKIQDSRIALCIPATGLSRRRSQYSNEMATIRETLGAYRIQRDTEGELIRTTLQRRLEETEEQLWGEESVRFSQGQIITNSSQKPDPAAVFAGLTPEPWFSRLAGSLLAGAYPDLPIDGNSLPRPVTSADPPELFREIFSQPGFGASLLSQLGPGLGLTAAQLSDPPEFPSSNVAILIRKRLARLSSPVQWSLIHNYLSHEAGLTGQLAILYLLLYIHHEQPRMEVRLGAGHQMMLADGSPLLGTRLTADLIPYLKWDDEIGRWANTIGPVTEPEWNDALLYLSVLCPGLTPIAEGKAVEDQEASLLRNKAEFEVRLSQATNFLRSLRMSATDHEAEGPGNAVGRLAKISGNDSASIFRSIKSAYQNHQDLTADITALDRLTRLSDRKDDILSAQVYLDHAAVPLAMAELSIQHQALQEAISPGPLLRSPRGWEGLAPEITRFKSQYALAYRDHHGDIHRSLAAYLRDLAAARRKMNAHSLLNALPELGEPTGGGLFEKLGQIDPGPSPCQADSAVIDLEATPICPSCHLSLDWTIPSGDLARLASAIDGVLEDKNRRLSNLLVERVLEGNNGQRLNDFIAIVQASDLSALSNKLNEDLLAFIRQLLV